MSPAPASGNNAAYSQVALAAPAVDVLPRGNGEILLDSRASAGDMPHQVNDYLRLWAEKSPGHVFLAERGGDEGNWTKLTYGEAADAANRISAWLIARGHSAANPVAALCDNCINMALLKLGAMQVGIPFLPISPAYSLMSESFSKLKHVIALFTPSLIYVPAIAPFARALKVTEFAGDLVSDVPDPAWPQSFTMDEVRAAAPSSEVERRYADIGPDSVAKILLTSGSTGMPKGVINTQRMMCANGVAIDAAWPFLAEKRPVIVDWLPWNHTFGTNFNFNQILRHGGTMWIDGGKPVPGKLDITLKNMREVQPTLLYNVPRGFDAILPTLEADDDFARHVFEKLDIIFYAGSALPPHLWRRLDALSVRVRGERVPILSSLGSTETAPVSTLCHWRAADIGGVGLPVAGVSVKLVPEGQKLEIRIKGPNVTPGYYRQPELTEKAFDDEGFFKLGDAVRFVDPERPENGLLFDGRVSENFKLSSGTWVHVGELRVGSISAASPAVQDAVVTGHDRDEVGLLVFLDPAGCREICGEQAGDPARHPALHAHVRAAFEEFNRHNVGSSRRIARVLLMTEPPSIDGNEITDKGYINQRAVLQRRAAMVERLYAEQPGPDVVVLEAQASPARAAQS